MEKSQLQNDLKENIVKNAAYNSTVKIIQNQDIVKASDIGNIKDNINDLIQSYSEYPENEQEPIIYNEELGNETYEGVDIGDDF